MKTKISFNLLRKSKSKVALVYGHIASNFGDVAITLAVLESIKRVRPDREIVVIFPKTSNQKALDALAFVKSQHPNLEHRFYDAESRVARIEEMLDNSGDNTEGFINQYKTLDTQLLTELGIADAGLVLFNSSEFLFSNNNKAQDTALLAKLLPLIEAVQKKIPLAFLPVTVGPLKSPILDGVVSYLVKASKHFAFRESFSRQFFQEKKNKKNIPELLDPAYFLEGIKKEQQSKEQSKTVLLAPRIENYGLRTPQAKSAESLRKFTSGQYGLSQSYKYYFVICEQLLALTDHVLNLVAQTTADKYIVDALYKSLSEKYGTERVNINRPQTLPEYIDLLLKAKLVITSRFHCIIFCHLFGIPAYAVQVTGGGHKIPGLMKLLGLKEYCTSISKGDGSILRILQLLDNPKEYLENLNRSLKKLKPKTENYFSAILK